MKLKTQRVSLGLVGFGSSLMAMAIMNPAQSYSLNFLGTDDLGSSWRYNYQFTVGSGELLTIEDSISIKGLENNAVAREAPELPDSFKVNFSTPPGTVEWLYSSESDSSGPVTYQTFVIETPKTNVVDGQVDWSFTGLNGQQNGTVTGPVAVPEPITIIGSVAALGFGAMCQRELSKKQKKSPTKDIG